MPPSENWSKDIFIQNILFNRNPLASIDSHKNIFLLYPYEKGQDKVGFKIYNEEMNIVNEKIVDVDELNFNKISMDEIFVDRNKVYWRDNEKNIVYVGEISDSYDRINIQHSFNRIKYFHHFSEHNISYLALMKEDGNVLIKKFEDDKIKDIEGPKDLSNIEKFKIYSSKDNLYLQIMNKDKETGLKNITISQYMNNEWMEPVKIKEINDMKIKIRDIAISSDDKNIYSIITIQNDDKSKFTYLVNGYEKNTSKIFEDLRLDHGMNFGIGYFSSIPLIIGSNNDGIKIITTAPTNLDLYSRNASNVVKLQLNEKGIIGGKLLSKTKSWSNRPSYVKGNNEYIFWNEPEKGEYSKVLGATTEKSVVERTTKVTKSNIRESIGEEIPVITSYNFLLSFVVRILSILPAIIWYVYLSIRNEKLRKSWDKMVIVGMIIFYIFQIVTIKDFYNPSTIEFMPKIMIFKGSKFIIPAIFVLISYYIAKLFSRETKIREGYKIYLTFLIFSYLLMNHLYAPFLFMYK
ncbi:hypothetical protein NSA23_14600 [Anaerosalibacter massiliensis]|uniref:Uncharacterized protein n=2 Tax=Anaerosalibacter massiliensis TaxID=1347392 RepID=A0A9X2S663_9FIRM|nr:hypothetical protein [Anaerosalibacter massiliensis]